MTPHILAALKALNHHTDSDLSKDVRSLGTNSNRLRNWWYPGVPELSILTCLKAVWENMKTNCRGKANTLLLDKLISEYDEAQLRSLHCKVLQVVHNVSAPLKLNHWRGLSVPQLKAEMRHVLEEQPARKRRRK